MLFVRNRSHWLPVFAQLIGRYTGRVKSTLHKKSGFCVEIQIDVVLVFHLLLSRWGRYRMIAYFN